MSKSNELPIETPHRDARISESVEHAEKMRVTQAPNRASVWSRSQNPRAKAMSGPRFEQTIMELQVWQTTWMELEIGVLSWIILMIQQPAPEAAITLIHKQPVRWTHDRMVACDGGGGPLGHPKIFINTDKPQICTCTYCGLPFVSL